MSDSGGQMIKIEPQPKWQEEPVRDDDGSWVGRYQYITYNDNVGVDVDSHVPPSTDVEPKEIDGAWFWVKPSAS